MEHPLGKLFDRHMFCQPSVLLAVGLLAGLFADGRAVAANYSSMTIYCCEPTQGKKICGDLLPPSCFGKEYRVMRQGMVVRRVAAPLTAEERANRAAELRIQKEQDRVKREERRQDQALLEAYPSLELLNSHEKDALDALDRSLADLVKRQEFLRARKRRLETEIEALPEGVVAPAEQRIELRVVASELESNEEVIKAKEIEKDQIRQEYGENRARYLNLRPHEAEGKSGDEGAGENE